LYRAVIVDDEPFMLEGMRMMIDWQRCGFTLSGEAGNAQDALHLVDTLQPHLLITDVRMPGMLGTDLAAIVNRYHPGILILFFSGYRDFGYAQSAIRSHAFGYLVKPIDVEEVESTLLQAKAELDARKAATLRDSGHMPILRDQVFSRLACGDMSAENLLRAGALLQLRTDDPCWCAVLSRRHGAVSDQAKLVLASANAALFELSSGEYGLCFQQIERDIQRLERLTLLLSERDKYTLSAGGIHTGVQGFHRSLLEALDAQGALYEVSGSLRLYKPFDAQTTAWLDYGCLVQIRESLLSGKPDALEAAMESLRKTAAASKPGLFALRCMATTLDAMLPANASDLCAPPGHPLWQQDVLEPGAWLDAFADQLHAMRKALLPGAEQSLPAAVLSTAEAIRTRYMEPLSLSRIALDLHINPAYLGQLFKKHTGSTFHRQLLMVRIEHACLLLRQTMSPVGEIAINVGFRDMDYFSQRFRSRMGMNPVAYRYAVAPKEDVHAPNQ
jgi:two-component system, response regulator YesN